MENLSRVAGFSGKLGLKVLEGALEGLVRGLLKCFGPERLSMFIANDWNILESFFYGLYRPPLKAYGQMKPQEAERLERFRRSMAETVLPIIGMARTIASRFPAEAVEDKVKADWLLEKCGKCFPELVSVINMHGERGRMWLEAQAKQIRDYLLGRIAYHPGLMRFVKVEKLKAVASKT